VLNRANTKVGLSKREVESALKVEVSVEIPSDRGVPISVNQGNPAVLADPGCEFSKAMTALSRSLVSKPEAKRSKRRLSLARAGWDCTIVSRGRVKAATVRSPSFRTCTPPPRRSPRTRTPS
jgi:MinD-like ATPase involved in chromosome partitioning or flagellar assembly